MGSTVPLKWWQSLRCERWLKQLSLIIALTVCHANVYVQIRLNSIVTNTTLAYSVDTIFLLRWRLWSRPDHDLLRWQWRVAPKMEYWLLHNAQAKRNNSRKVMKLSHFECLKPACYPAAYGVYLLECGHKVTKMAKKKESYSEAFQIGTMRGCHWCIQAQSLWSN